MVGSRILTGAFAGFIATAPMTLAMELMHRMLPAAERYPLPPSEITAELTDDAGVSEQLEPEQHVALTLVNHFAYGAGVGSIYGALANKLPLSPMINGIGFGLGVWAVSYLGLLPAMGILRPATEHPARRNVLMIVAHVVWGSVTGLVVERLR